MNYVFSSYSEIGKRDKNEDSVLVGWMNCGLLAVVADGVGGESGGEQASALAVESIAAFLQEREPSAEALKAAILEADQAVRHLKKDNAAPQTTVAALWLTEEKAFAAHVGDSRIYQLRDGEIIFRSRDHSLAYLAVLNGEITPDEVPLQPARNVILRSLGGGESVRADFSELEIREGDAFLLCSDGFWEYVPERRMTEIEGTAKAEQQLRRLSRPARENAADNNSAVLILSPKTVEITDTEQTL